MSMEKYHFSHEGTEYELPFITGLKVGARNRLMLASTKATEAPFDFYEEVFSAVGELREVVEDMHDEEFTEFFTGWTSASTPATGK